VDEPLHNHEKVPGSVNDMSNDDLVMQCSTEQLQQALKQITSKTREKEQLCEELECIVVELDF